MKKFNTIIIIMLCVFCAQSYGQMIISAGAIRGGALFLADEVFLFIGVKIHIGYLIYFGDEDDYDGY